MASDQYINIRRQVKNPQTGLVLGSVHYWYGPDPEGKLYFRYSAEKGMNGSESYDSLVQEICAGSFRLPEVNALVSFVVQWDDDEVGGLDYNCDLHVAALEKNGFKNMGKKPCMCLSCGTTLVYIRRKHPDRLLTAPAGEQEPVFISMSTVNLGEPEIPVAWYFSPFRYMI